MKLCILLASIPLFLSCNAPKAPQAFSLGKEVGQLPNIQGKKGNGNYLYVTAGNNLYSIGNQYGDFPPAGFHVYGNIRSSYWTALPYPYRMGQNPSFWINAILLSRTR